MNSSINVKETIEVTKNDSINVSNTMDYLAENSFVEDKDLGEKNDITFLTNKRIREHSINTSRNLTDFQYEHCDQCGKYQLSSTKQNNIPNLCDNCFSYMKILNSIFLFF